MRVGCCIVGFCYWIWIFEVAQAWSGNSRFGQLFFVGEYVLLLGM